MSFFAEAGGGMLCEFCKKNESTLHFKQVYNGEVREIDICSACAEERGFDVQSSLSVTDFLFGMGSIGTAQKSVEEKTCGSCHMRPSDFEKSSRLGCPACYEGFAEQLEPMLNNMHKGVQHVGKVPAKEQMNIDLKLLRDELQRSVAEQDFEQAAVLRDRMKALGAGGAAVRDTVS